MKSAFGFTAIEYVAIVAAIAIATVAVVTASSGFFSSSNKNSALLEMSKLTSASRMYRIANNDYTGITVAALANGGYDVDPFTAANLSNVYGNNVTIAAVAGNATATITYITDSATACASLVARFSNADGVNAAACGADAAAATFTATIQ